MDNVLASAKALIEELQANALRVRADLKSTEETLKNVEDLKKKDKITLMLVKKQLQAKQKALMQALLQTRAVVDTALEEHQEVVDKATSSLDRCKATFTDKCLLDDPNAPPASGAGAAAGGRAALMRADQDLLAADHLPGAPAADCAALRGLTAHLHDLETTTAFQAHLLSETKKLSSDSDYTETNFAYGSTPFKTWYDLFQCDALQSALTEAAASHSQYMVWGSSTGWLAFYAALCFGVQCVGYELLGCLHAVAEETSASFGLQGRTHFVQGDMLDAPLNNVKVLILTSQCWDPELYARVGEKLSAELPAGAVVVDYTDKLKAWPALGGEAVHVARGPVSWNPDHALYVWRKQGPGPAPAPAPAPTLLPQRQAGTSGLRLSTLGLGCWQFGCAGGSDYWGLEYTQELADRMVAAAARLGLTYFDTAEDYGKGASERQLGHAVGELSAEQRGTVVIGSKILPNHCSDVRAHCEGTLQRLGVPCIDLYMVHWPIDQNSMAHFASHGPGPRDYSAVGTVDAAAVPPTMAAFRELMALQAEGKVRHIGVSNFGVRQLQEALATGAHIAVNQVCYNMIFRAAELEILPFLEAHGIAAIAYSPLMQGLLTGRWSTADEVPEFRARTRHFSGGRPRSRHGEAGHEPLLFSTLAQLQAECARHGLALPDVALAWPLHAHPSVACVVAGATREDQLERNARGIQLALPAELVERVRAITDPLKAAMGPNADLWQGGTNSRVH